MTKTKVNGITCFAVVGLFICLNQGFSQYEIRLQIEPSSHVLNKNDHVRVNSTDYRHQYNYGRQTNLGVGVTRINKKFDKLSYGLFLEGSAYFSKFTFEYNQFVPNDKIIQLDYSFRFINLNPQIGISLKQKRLEYLLRIGRWFRLNKINRDSFFGERSSLLTTEEMRIQEYREWVGDQKFGNGMTEFNVNYLISERSRIGLNFTYHWTSRVGSKGPLIYRLEIKNNSHDTSNSFIKDVVDIRIEKHSLDAGIVYTYVF